MVKVVYAVCSIHIIVNANSKLGGMFQNCVLNNMLEGQLALYDMIEVVYAVLSIHINFMLPSPSSPTSPLSHLFNMCSLNQFKTTENNNKQSRECCAART